MICISSDVNFSFVSSAHLYVKGLHDFHIQMEKKKKSPSASFSLLREKPRTGSIQTSHISDLVKESTEA